MTMKIKKSNIFTKESELRCIRCGKNLLEDVGLSMVQIVTDKDGNIVQFNPCCKGSCDVLQLPKGCSDGWQELSTFTNPYLYLKYIMSILNNLYNGHKFTNEQAFENCKNVLIALAPYVMRDICDSEKQNAAFDDQLSY